MNDMLKSFLTNLIIYAAVVGLAYLLARYIVTRYVFALAFLRRPDWRPIVEQHRLRRWVTALLTVLVAEFFLPTVVGFFPNVDRWVLPLSTSLVLLLTALTLNSLVNVALDIYETYPLSRHVPLTALAQVVKVVIFVFLAFIAGSLLVGVSPLYSISVLAASLAALGFVLQDMVRNIVAGLQLTGNRMVAIGDWIEMPEFGADGRVLEVNITAVKVQNWDRTISTVPTNAMVTRSFKNWRGMQESTGRRMQRSVTLDARSIEPAERDVIRRFADVAEVREYLGGFGPGAATGDHAPRPTNVGLFCAYLRSFLAAHPKLDPSAAFVVRQLAPNPQGLPIEIVAFSAEKDFVPFEAVQASIFEHLFAVLPEFGLRVYQAPAAEPIGQARRPNGAAKMRAAYSATAEGVLSPGGEDGGEAEGVAG